jgi:hypothetical protein
MCQRFGVECPGLDDGPVFIDMTKKARHGMQKRRRKLSVDVKLTSTKERMAIDVKKGDYSAKAVKTR